MAKHLRITQVHSAIRRDRTQKDTVRALGLHRLQHTVVHRDTPVVRGMIHKIVHLLKVEEVDKPEGA